MPLLSKQITVIAGHYGSGKTEFAVNLAIAAAETEKVILADLDIVNPYFCSREQEDRLKSAGVEIITPSPICRTADVPALPAEVARVFTDESAHSILDVGGDGIGAKVLARYNPQFSNCEYDMWIVLNANRPLTSTPESALEYIRTIERESRLTATGIVNNTHLCAATTPAETQKGAELAEKVSALTGLPIICSVVPKNGFEKYRDTVSGELFPIEIMMKKPWE